MTNARLAEILRRIEPEIKGGQGRWEIIKDGVPLMVVTDVRNNRMRIMAPVKPVGEVEDRVLLRLLEANFSTTLDSDMRFSGICSGWLSSTLSIRSRKGTFFPHWARW